MHTRSQTDTSAAAFQNEDSKQHERLQLSGFLSSCTPVRDESDVKEKARPRSLNS
ncbi:hypothetical protein NQZ68_003358 [Dissostichus eleginoides]|nr:hypothetical protein NQZ68_003358 [Dissostichus eleginoides]